MSERPDDNQRRAITAPTTHAILLQGGPGCGKTRTLIGRIAYLIKSQQAEASQIVALTFTNKAAYQLKRRLRRSIGQDASDVLVETFHSLAHHLLRQHAKTIGIDPTFTICDDTLRQEMLRQALKRSGMSPCADYRLLNDLRDFFAGCKRAGHEPSVCEQTHQLPYQLGEIRDMLPTIAQHYRALLEEHHMLDFDDLLFYASNLLAKEESIRQGWQTAHPWLFIDEFHDINQGQYDLVRQLVVPGSPTIMAVTDEQQRIYRWRGANREYLAQFRRDYRPVSYQLSYSYRSGVQLMQAYDKLLHRGGISRHSTVAPQSAKFWAEKSQEGFIERWWSQNEEQESEWLFNEIQRLQEEEGYQLSDMAVLYRAHRIGKHVEKKLLQQGLPPTQIQRKPFFERVEAQQLCRYLQTTLSVADKLTGATLTLPAFLKDELAMVQLRQLAREGGMTELALMRQLVEEKENGEQKIGPATRYNIQQFLRLVDEELAPLRHASLQELSDTLFDTLAHQRSPYQTDELDGLRAMMEEIDVSQDVALLQQALQSKQPIQLLTTDTFDAHCAAVLFQQVLKQFFDYSLSIEQIEPQTQAQTQPSPVEGALRIMCGGSQKNKGALNIMAREIDIAAKMNHSTTTSPMYEISISADSQVAEFSMDYQLDDEVDHITEMSEAMISTNQHKDHAASQGLPSSYKVSATFIAWRLLSALLVAGETTMQRDLVAFDLETTGLNPHYHSAVELAAQRVQSGEPVDDGFEQLVNPGRSITQGAIDVHGIYPQQVQDAPHVHDALPSFLDYLSNHILLGHNVGFDMRFLHALAQRANLPPLQNPILDTLALARRLYPNAPSYRLEALIDHLHLPTGRFHRAMPDVQHTINLFTALWQSHRLDQQLYLLSDYLPLVAVTLAESEEDDASTRIKQPFFDAAKRVMEREPPYQVFNWLTELPKEAKTEARARLKELNERHVSPTAEDERWNTLRKEWNDYLAQVTQHHELLSLSAFLSHTALIHGESDITSQDDQLKLMTIHAAKGQEFRAVFLIGLEDGNLPSYHARTREEIAEERRVCYVGMSRAQERLYLLGTSKRGKRERDPSIFWRALDGIF